MSLHTDLPADIDTVDVIIAGGGTAGCIIASRLADADPSLSILVIEAGPNGAGIPTVDFPAFFLGNLTPTSGTTTFYKSSKPSDHNGPDLFVPTASVLGGGSAVNMMQYSRAQRADWDSWESPGWYADDILSYIKRLETYHGPGAQEHHGSEGPIQVSTSTYSSSRLQGQYIAATNQLGWPEIEDLSNLDDCNGVQRSLRYVSLEGKRQDTASRYLRPRLEDGKHPNLHVVVNSQVIKVLVENKTATGLIYRPKSDGAVERTMTARKQVVVSAGAFGTPAILERSGIGNPEVLKRAGISEIVAEVPGVGHEYQDHNMLLYAYKSALEPDETMDRVLTGEMGAAELIRQNHGILGWNAQEATSKIRPSEEDVASFDPKLKEVWEEEYKDNPNKPLMMLALVCCYPGEPTGVPPGQYFAISTFTVYPLSKGHLHITGPGLDDPVDFNAGFFSDAHGVDVKKHRWAYKKQREIARRMPVFRGEYAPNHPSFPAGSKAALVELDGPPPLGVSKIEYSAEDDAAIDDFARRSVGSTWHSLGTCKMAPLEQNGVVDSSLNVYGVKGLKLADLSIVPKNVAANTANTAMVIGEKAADIIIEELGLGRH